jgi:D-alanyl-D-alanine carboxypeptidase
MNPTRRLLRPWLISVCLLVFAVGTSRGAESATAASLATQIDEQLAKTFPPDAPGAAVLVISHGEVLLRKGYGAANLELGVPVKPEHVFRLGSITKQFTAVAILQLAEAGKLKLDDDITTYVPEVETFGKKITITHLLSHTSGLPSFTDQPEWRAAPRQDMTLTQELAFIKGKPAKFAPGTSWEYCNTGYRLLGAVIEKVTGQTYAAYVAEHIFKPAGMTNSLYDDARKIIPQRIPGYSAGPRGTELNAEYVSMTQPHAAGALLSTVDDLWKWEQALAAGKLVRPDLLAQAYTAARLPDGRATGYGFGWSLGTIAGHPAVSHGGGIQGFSTFALRVADAGLFAAVLCNADNPKAAPGATATRIARQILGKSVQATVPVSSAKLEAFVGVYRLSPTEKMAFVIENDRLVSKDSRGRNVTLDAAASDNFYDPASDTHFVILGQNDAGRATRVLVRPRFALERFATRVDEPFEDPAKPAVAVAVEILDKYAGDYELLPNFILTVKREGVSLTAQATGQGVTNLIAESPTRFRIKQVPAAVEFQVDVSGKVTGLILHQNGRELPGKRQP